MRNDFIIKNENGSEENLLLFTITVKKEDVEEYLEEAYQKKKGSLKLEGLPNGHISRAVYEKATSHNVFLEDALNLMINAAVEKLLKEPEYEIISIGNVNLLDANYDKEAVFTIEVVTRPNIVLGQYKGLKYKKTPVSVDNQEVVAYIDSMRKKGISYQIVDRPVKEGDKISLDFKGFVDGVAFEGGEGKNYDLVIGSHSFIPGFEEQLVGATRNNPLTIDVVFPEGYHAENLKGKPAKFECNVNLINEPVLPSLDELVADAELNSLEELMENVRNDLYNDKLIKINNQMKDALLSEVIENSKFHLPEPLLKAGAEATLKEMQNGLAAQGLSLEQYLQFTNTSYESLFEQAKLKSTYDFSSRLVLDAIAEAENLCASDEEVNEEIKKMADQYGTTIEQINNIFGGDLKKELCNSIMNAKALDLIANSSIDE